MMKHRSALGLHLQRFEAPTKELNFRKKQTQGDLDHLHQLYNDTLTRITSRPLHTDSQSTGRENQDGHNDANQDDVVTNISQVYEQNRRRLELLVAFMSTKSKDLLKIKRTFQKEFPLKRARRNVGGHGGQLSSDQYHEQKEKAVQKMTRSLGRLSEELHRRLNTEKSHELEDFLSELNLLDARSPKRNLLHAKPPVILSPRRKSSVSKPRRTSSISKERYLNKAKRAARKTPRSSKETSNSTSSVSDHNSTQESSGNRDGSGSESSQDKNLEDIASNASLEIQDSVSDLKDGHTVIQVQEVTSSVQDRSKLDSSSSAGDSTESSIMTSSTVSAMLGDSSLQLSADHSDDKGASGSESSTDNVSPVLTEDAKEKPSANEDLTTKRREALLLRPRSSEGSRYLLFGINPAPEGKDQASTGHSHPRTGRAPQRRSLARLYSNQHSPYRRWQSPYHHANPWYHGHYQPYHHYTSRHSQPPHPQYHSASANYARRLKPDKPPRHTSKSPSKLLLKRMNEDLPRQGLDSGSSSEEQASEGSSGVSRTESSESTRQHVACWSQGFSRGSLSVSSGPNEGSRASSVSSPIPEDETKNGCNKDVQVKSGRDGSGERSQAVVRVRLITMEQVHKHRGPGLLDHNTQADSFLFSRDKTLDELTELVHKRLKLSSACRVRLWLFEEDQEGLFLPRHLLHGSLAQRTVGSLNRDTVTLFVQTTESRERVFSVDHNKVRFVFVKAPQCDTGEFVVKGHDHIDVSKATRAIIQVLKKKFFPRCRSSVKLYVESEGKTMYCVTHSPASTFRHDTEGRGRHGDILLLLEDFIDQHQSVADQPAPLNDTGTNGNHVSYPQPHHNPPTSNDSEASSGSEVVWSSDDQADSVDCPADSVDCGASSPMPGCENSDMGRGQHQDEPTQDGAGDGNSGHAAAPSAWPKKGETIPTSNFIISQDSSTSGSDESVSSPVRGVQLLNHANIVRGRRFVQWNLTGDYFARFNRIQEENEDLCENGQVEQAAPDMQPENGGGCREHDAVDVSSRLEVTSLEYESLVVSSVQSDGTSHDGMTSCDASCMTSHDASCMTSRNASCVSESVASDRTADLTDQFSDCHLHTSSMPASPSNTTEDSGHRSGHSSAVSITGCQVSAGQDNVLVTTLNLNGNHNPLYPCDDDVASAMRNLNPVAVPFTPRTLLRMKNDLMQKRLAHRTQGVGDQRGAVGGKVEVVEKDKCGTARSSHPSVPSTPSTPHSNGHLTSDEDISVYYTPGHGFAFPDTRPELQSSVIPLADLNSSQSPGPLHPDQLSAITNCSSSFMAIRVSRQSPGRLHQISAIPNISSSFMEIPPQLQLHHSTLPGHSTSLSSLHQRHSSSCQPDPSFQAATSPRSPHTDGDTSHLRANVAALPPRPPRAVHTSQMMTKPGKGMSYDAKKNGSYSQPAGLQFQRMGEGHQHGSREASGVQQEDPAIMGVGKQVLAQKSSLNANAVEFVPKGKSETFSPQQVNENKTSGKLDKAVSPAGPSAAPFPYGGHPLINKLYNHAMYQQRVSFPPNRPPSTMPRPAPISGFPINRPLPGSMCNTRQPPSMQTTRARPPILVSMTDGAQTNPAPRPRHDPARHVTFADQPARPGRPGPRSFCRHMNSASQVRVQLCAHYGMKPTHSASTEAGSSSRQDPFPPLRRKIGSGRFNEGPRRHLGELRNSTQRENAFFPHSNSAYNCQSRDYRSPSPSFLTRGRHDNCARNHGDWYGDGRHAEHPAARPFRRREGFSADPPPMAPRHAEGSYHARRHPNFIPPPHPHNQHFPPEDQWYSQGPPCPPPHPNSHKSHRSSHNHPGPEEYAELQGQRNRLNAVSGSTDFRFRRPIRTQSSSNSSSDQSDSTFQNYRPGNPRFHKTPVSDHKRESSFNSGTLRSEECGNSGRDVSTENPVTESRLVETGSGEDSESKSSQTSGGSQKCLHVRRGYIQLGLSDSARPTYMRTVSDP